MASIWVSHQCVSCSGPSWPTGWGRSSGRTARHTCTVSPRCAVSCGCSGPTFHWRSGRTTCIQTSCRSRREAERKKSRIKKRGRRRSGRRRGAKKRTVIYWSQSWHKMLENLPCEKGNGGCWVLTLTATEHRAVWLHVVHLHPPAPPLTHSESLTHTHKECSRLLVCHVCISRHWFFCPGLPPPPFILCFAPRPRGLEKFCNSPHKYTRADTHTQTAWPAHRHTRIYTPQGQRGKMEFTCPASLTT